MLEKSRVTDLSLNISPPNPNTDPSSFDIWQETAKSFNYDTSSIRVDTELSLSNPAVAVSELDVSTNQLRPIKGIPVYNNGFFSSSRYLDHQMQNPTFSSPSSPSSSGCFRAFQPLGRFNGITMEALSLRNQHLNQTTPHLIGVSSDFSNNTLIHRSRFMPRIHNRRNARAPRMRWTSSLHARFIRAVKLLGGHERATPKSVLELMDVKDLTLAHVKSHLQMYRTVKNTDRQTASSEGSGDEDFLPATPTPHQEANCLLNHRRGSSASMEPDANADVNADVNGSSPSINNLCKSSASRRAWEQGSENFLTHQGSENHLEESYDLTHGNSFMGLNLNLNSPSMEFPMRHKW